jgi:general secretion pathway protein A
VRAEAALYGQHFGLTQAPFRATPDPRFFYSNPVYREAYATLLYGVLQRKGFIALTGEIGTGKTTLLRRLMDELGPPVRFVLFYNTTLTFDETVEFICGELELPVTGLSRVQRLQRLNDLLIAEARQGGNVVLLIDEAQNLGPDVLENLRLISNLETATEKLLQIVLVGQPELDGKLADPTLRQVSQRIAIRYRLEPLRDHEIGSFIDHRLRQCGATRRALFTADAIQRISAYSRGVPRLINILCDGALLAGYAAGTRRVTGGLIDEVAADLKLARRDEPPGLRPTMAASGRPFRRRDRSAAAARTLRWATPSLVAVALAFGAVALIPDSPRGGTSSSGMVAAPIPGCPP